MEYFTRITLIIESIPEVALGDTVTSDPFSPSPLRVACYTVQNSQKTSSSRGNKVTSECGGNARVWSGLFTSNIQIE